MVAMTRLGMDSRLEDDTDVILVFSAAMRERREAERWRRVWRALVLASDVEVFEALVHGESVPLSRLDPAAVERFARRE
jgi:hypothetical protein